MIVWPVHSKIITGQVKEVHNLLQRETKYKQTLNKSELQSQEYREDDKALSLYCADVKQYVSSKLSFHINISEYEQRLIQSQEESVPK